MVTLLQQEIERLRREGFDPEIFRLVKNQMYGETLGSMEQPDDAAEDAADACLKGRTLAEEIEALAVLTVMGLAAADRPSVDDAPETVVLL